MSVVMGMMGFEIAEHLDVGYLERGIC